MIGTSPLLPRTLCCHDGIWQLVSSPPPKEAEQGSWMQALLGMERHIAALEKANQALRAETGLSQERAQFDLAEAEHRLKNAFAIVHAIAVQTARPGDTGEAYRASFEARLLALARSHELLGSRHPDGAPLAEVIGRCLQPYDDAPGRTIVSGPMVHLSARDVPALGLTFHELATNAAKHGALSIPEGRVEVTWQLEERRKDQVPSVAIIWRERGGPPVKAPERRGFGSRLLERGMTQGSGSTAQLDFAPGGVDCRIWLPVSSIQAPGIHESSPDL